MRNTYLNLTDEDRDYLVALTRKRTIQVNNPVSMSPLSGDRKPQIRF